ncbi:molybdenum ABC transporter ATP-binding protein [Ideonella livida]|uniref:Molybdenum ABC transporter ATP-binding protein n=1 Tax=Ideonella livida TaxID=2707176 RepID=A0A7C9PJI8_9BURK|nr:molybdenum ABC transporter ATP-binding protein [Ideonella livida]NDY93575.1 molybdenum ABC transporter ATP-binding protein [Ideonella livida]
MTAPGPLLARFGLSWPGFSLDVDLTLPGQGVTALFGPSGSGKTTLLRCIAGLERPAQGRLVVQGQTWQDGRLWVPPHRRPIGYVFQEASLFAHLSVLGNLRYGLRRSGLDGSPQATQRLEQAIGLLGIGHLLERRPDRLSGGERQRVGIARALAVCPRLMLLDEPLAALDQRRKEEILPYLERLHRELDIPMLYVTHAPQEMARLADHVVLLEQGRVVQSGPVADTLSRLDLRLGEEQGAVVEAVVDALDPEWHLVRVAFDGGQLWTRDPGATLGQRVRVRVLARDVSLARHPPGASSIQNLLPAQVVELAQDEHPGLALVRLRLGNSHLVARLTRRAAAELGIAVGQPVWAQVKSVALMR